MQRRQFIRKLSAGATALGFRPAFGAAAAQPQVAITMDDFDLFGETPAEKETNSRVIRTPCGAATATVPMSYSNNCSQ
jgi:hypothetical protein